MILFLLDVSDRLLLLLGLFLLIIECSPLFGYLLVEPLEEHKQIIRIYLINEGFGLLIKLHHPRGYMVRVVVEYLIDDFYIGDITLDD